MKTSNWKPTTICRFALATVLAGALCRLAVAQEITTWTGGAGDGLWGSAGNWSLGVPAEGTNAVIGSGATVTYGAPMTASSFGSLTNSGTLNVNAAGFTIDAGGGVPLTMMTNANSLIRVNAGGVLTLANSGPVAVYTTNNIAVEGGTFIVTNSTSGNFALGLNGNNGGVGFTNNGGTVYFGQHVSLRGRYTRFIMRSGTLDCPLGFSIDETGNDQERPVLIAGGTANLGAFSVSRTTSGGGLLISNGVINATSIQIGTAASRAYAAFYGGTLTNTGLFTISDRTTGASTGDRKIQFLVRGGTVVSTSPEGIIVINQDNSTPAANSVIGTTLEVSAGTLIAEKLSLMKDNTFYNAWATLNLSGSGVLCLGSGGLIANPGAGAEISPATSAYYINFNGGTIAAKGDYTIAANMALGGTTATFQAADLANTPYNISVDGVLSGSAQLLKTGGGTLTLNSNNTYTGYTVIRAGKLALGPAGGIASSLQISLAQNASLDVAAVTGGWVHSASRTLSGFGSILGNVSAASGSTLNPGSNLLTGTLSFSNSLTQAGGVVNQFDLSTDPAGPNNDLIVVGGDLNVTGLNTISLNGGGADGSLHKLFQYGGSFNGSLENFQVVGPSGKLTNDTASRAICFLVSTPLRGPTNITWIGNATLNDWDIHNHTNWLNNGALDFFLFGDTVRFDATGASHPLVNLADAVSPTLTVVDATAAYTFTGSGSITGSGGLVKTNTGTLTILTTNTYTGPTVLGGGVLEVPRLANGGIESPIGAASIAADNLVFDGGTLRYTGESVGTDHGATLSAGGGTLDVATGITLTLNGALSGPGGLTKAGLGTVTLPVANAYTGTTTVTGGTLRLNNTAGAGTGPVTLAGGTLHLAGSSDADFPYSVEVATTSGLTMGSSNNRLNGGVSGASTLNVDVSASGSATLTLNGNMTNFTGVFDLGASIGVFRLNSGGGNSTFGCPNATVNLGTGSAVLQARNAGTMVVGALQGGPSTMVKGQGSGSGTLIWVLGTCTNNPSTTFEGTIANGDSETRTNSITKVGSGTLTLKGANTYSGATTISGGVIALSESGSIDYSGTIRIAADAVLNVTGRSDATLNLGQYAAQTVSGNGMIQGSLAVSGWGTVAPGAPLGTLTVANAANLGGTVLASINRAGSPNCGKLVCPSITLGGTLVITNVGPLLQVGDAFDLFDGTLSGGFTSVVLPSYYTWDTSTLATDGIVRVAGALPLPTFTLTSYSGTEVVLSAVQGIPNNPLVILSSTNAALPLSSWTPIATNSFDVSGNFSLTVPVDPAAPQNYYLLEAF